MIKILILAFFLSSCASQTELDRSFEAQEANVLAQTQMVQQPICDFKCGTVENPCQNVELKCYTQRSPIKIPRITGTNDVIISVIHDVVPLAETAVTWGFGSKIVSDIMDTSGGNNVTTHNTSTIVGDDNNQTASTDVSKTTDNSLDNSIDNSAVSTPTIVEQPPVQVVTQPDPIIVPTTQVPTQVIEPSYPPAAP